MEHGELHEMVDQMLAFCGVKPDVPIEGNIGTVWFMDKNTGKQFYIAIGECEE